VTQNTHHSRHWLIALSPIFIFISLYLVVSLISGDFYLMPLSVALLTASVWAVAVARGESLTHRIETFSRAAAEPNIIYMIWIFILAGAFAALAKGIGAIDATVALTMKFIDPRFVIPGMFVAACLISMSIGTSVGTVVALVPLAAGLGNETGEGTAMITAAVLGGAFFGDNLSFISDTTIAATRSLGIKPNEKFKANFRIVLPAAIISLIIYSIVSPDMASQINTADTNFWLVVPYLLVIILALTGLNVTVVLTIGIITALIIAVIDGNNIFTLAQHMGDGVDSMGNLIIITLLASGMLGMVKAMGGIDAIIHMMTRTINGSRGAQALIATLVGLVDICTANNTVAILTVGSMSKDISTRFGIDPRKTASILDTASCIIQCLIPYGAQSLLATKLAHLSPADVWPYLYYPWILTATLIISIILKNRPSKP
jgi:Na+/H+ antiporter NhaC